MLALPAIGVLLLVGFISGVIGALLGLGGGIIMIPILAVVYPHFGINPAILSHILFGTNLFVVSFSSLFSTFRYHIQGLVIWRAVFPVASFSIIGAFVGSSLAARISSELLLQLFGVLMLAASLRMFYEVSITDDRKPVFNIVVLIVTGLLSATLAVMLGLGGGIVTIPIMIFVLRFPVRKVPGTSSGIIFFTALSGMTGYIMNGWNDPLIPERALGYVYLSTGIPLMVGALCGVPLGTWINSKISTKRIRQIFGILMFAVFIKMTFF